MLLEGPDAELALGLVEGRAVEGQHGGVDVVVYSGERTVIKRMGR